MTVGVLLWVLRVALLALWVWAVVDCLVERRRYRWLMLVAAAPLTLFGTAVLYGINFAVLPRIGIRPLDATWERRRRLLELRREAKENDLPATWLELAKLHFEAQEWQQCLEALRRPVDVHPDDADGSWMAGVSLLRLGRPEPALAYLAFVAEDSANGRGGYAWLRMGEALEALGRVEEALPWFRRAEERQRLVEAGVREAKALDRLQRRAEGILVLARVIERSESMSRTPEEDGWLDEAKELLERWQVPT